MAPYIGATDGPDSFSKKSIPEIHCIGTPYEIGFKHGKEASLQISRTIEFYTKLFRENARLDWSEVMEVAKQYEPEIRQKWPRYIEEMQGVADGAQVALLDIVACNVRTEIAYGLFSDGCTALSWRTDEASFMAQNWDWQEEQKRNLIILTIEQPERPLIKMVTEAGLIGKIGLNSAGVGVCLNAIRAKGMDTTRLPCHLGLRMVLENHSREEAVQQLEKYKIASACHMLIADATGGIGLEWSSTDVKKCYMNDKHQVFHSNHYLLEHATDGSDKEWLVDSSFRVKRIEQMANEIPEPPTRERIFELFKDETNYPGAICRAQKPPSSFAASLFNIVMDLKAKCADVTLGRPTEPEGYAKLAF